MQTTEKSGPPAATNARKQRESAALRENLYRRKAQARARQEPADGEAAAAPLAPEPPAG